MSKALLRSHPDRPLTDHLHQVEQASRLILARHPPRPFSVLGLEVSQVLWALAGWHDVAKATDYFQDFIRDPAAFERRSRTGDPYARPELKTHTPLGSLLTLCHWQTAAHRFSTDGSKSAEIDASLVCLLIALAVRGHHSALPTQVKLRDGFQTYEIPEQLERLSSEVESCHPSLSGAVGPLLALECEELQLDALEFVGTLFQRLRNLPLPQRLRFRLAAQFCFSCLLEADKALLIHDDPADYIGRSGMLISATVVEDHPPPAAGDRPIDRQRDRALAVVVAGATSAGLDDFQPRTLTLPTGLGKTRCAAAWAFHWRARLEAAGLPRPKILIVLPFLSVIEQTARVYRNELLQLGSDAPPNDPTLAVSHSLSARDFDDLEEPEHAEFALDTWRSDIVLTTFDQFLLSLMEARAKYQQRFHNLCDALVIVDEVQALPCVLWHPVGSLLVELARAGRTRILLMTATQPGLIGAEDSASLIPRPADYAQARYRLEWDLVGRSLTDWLQSLSAEMVRPENAKIRKWLIILNTRKTAQAAFRYFRDEERTRDQVFLLSSDIVPRDRLAKIAAIQASTSCVAVTTQCIEAGVDMDMDRVVRDFGPLDSLVQAAGRCNRHGLHTRGLVRVVYLINRDHDDRPFCSYVYDDTRLGTTLEVLKNASLKGWIDEEEVLPIVEDYFGRLHLYMDTGAAITSQWANFEHENLSVSGLLRGHQDQVDFVVGKLDPGLETEVKRAMRVKDRWERRRELRRLGPRLALLTVSAWKSSSYVPDDIADPLPLDWRARGWEKPAFWFLHDNAYDSELGLCPLASSACEIF